MEYLKHLTYHLELVRERRRKACVKGSKTLLFPHSDTRAARDPLSTILELDRNFSQICDWQAGCLKM